MRIFGTVNLLNFEAQEYTDAVRQTLETQFTRAARAFVRAAVPKIPVETGMARGSFLNIGAFLDIAVPIVPTKFGKFYYHGGRIPKTAESGAALTTPPDQIIKVEGDKITFEIQSSVFHLTLEDIIGVRSPSAPWQSFEAGRKAFMREMRRLIIPNVRSFITRTTITFGRGNVIKSAPIRLRRQEKTTNG